MRTLLGITFVLIVVSGALCDDTSSHIVGGKREVSVDDPVVQDLLKANLARLVTADGNPLESITITKITKQVVEGSKYEVSGSFKHTSKPAECVIIIWSRPWLEDIDEKTKLKADCEGQSLTVKSDVGAW